MRKLIITADDYGMSEAVNRAIDEGAQTGLITSTNLMTNMPYANEAMKLNGCSNFSVGIHFTLTCGRPVADVKKIPTLVSSSGEFYSFSEFRKRYRKKLISDAEILTELSAQYSEYLRIMGTEPDYWNTHQNVHVDFKIYDLFVRFAVDNRIKRMRSHQRIYVRESSSANKRSLKWRLLEPLKSRMLDSWQKKANRCGVASPDGIVVCLNKKDTNNPDYVFNNISWKSNCVAEYVIHPATENDSPYFGKIVDQRINEYNMFTSQQTKAIIAKAGLELTDFKF